MHTPHTSPRNSALYPAPCARQPAHEELAESVAIDKALLVGLDTLAVDGLRELRLLERENSRLLSELKRRRLEQP